MFSSLVFGVALATPAAPVPGDTPPSPVGPAPWVVYLKADAGNPAALVVYKTQKVTQTRAVTIVENGNAVVKQVQEQVDRLLPVRVALGDVAATFATARGAALTADGVLRRTTDGLVVLVSADGKPVEKAWLRAVDPDTVVLTAEGLATPVAPRPAVPLRTAAPRLTLLGTGPDGQVQVAYNPAVGDGLGDGVVFAQGGRVVFVNNGGINQPIFLNNGPPLSNPSVAPVKAPVKSLADVPFDAYDRTGKMIGRAAALHRLTAGGLVLIAGDNQEPDPAYLSIFRGELLTLVAAELTNVPTGGAATGAIRAAAFPAQLLPAVVAAPAIPLAAPVVAPQLVLRPAAAPAKSAALPPAEKRKN